MHASQRAFLGGILDYAGLFPPARLSLNEAVRNYARYLREPEGWMLGRFICPSALLEELATYVAELFGEGSSLRISVLGRGGETETAFLDNLHLDLEAVNRFRERHREGVAVESFETRLPRGVLGIECHGASESLLRGASAVFSAADLATLPRFYEITLATKNCRPTVQAVAGALAELNRRPTHGTQPRGEVRPSDRGVAGIKLRCGGLEPAAFPSVGQVTTVIEESVHAGVPLKFTAGLHHPTRRLDPGFGGYVHGFLNVFAAGILADALELESGDVVAVVEEENVRQFKFSDDFFAWSEAEATVSEIEYARQHCVISFGSCSFDEPRAELRELDLI
jgi:hypothetical protein